MKGPSDAASADGKSTRWRAKRTSPPLLLFSLFSAFPASSAALDRLLGEVRCFCFVGGGEWGRYERGMVGNRGVLPFNLPLLCLVLLDLELEFLRYLGWFVGHFEVMGRILSDVR